MDASIIVPSYKAQRTIQRCLNGLLEQNTNFTYEIILVDSSPGPEVDEIAAKFPTILFVKLKKQTYAGIARNIGVERARGDLLIFVDDDIVVLRHWLENVIKYSKSGHDVFSSAIDMWRQRKFDIIGSAELFFEFSAYKITMNESTRWCLPSCALAVKRRLFENEKFTNLKRCQDVDFTIRLRKNGVILYFNPTLKVYHIPTLKFQILLWKAFYSGLGEMKIRKMHEVSGTYFVRNPILCFFAIPGFAVIKLTKISWRNIRHNKLPDKILYVAIFPVVLAILMAWILGFYKGMFLSGSAKS